VLALGGGVRLGSQQLDVQVGGFAAATWLIPARRRDRLRLQAAGRFAGGDGINEIARDLRVTPGSARRWHRAWRDGGPEALRSKGPVSRERPLIPRRGIWSLLKRSMVNFAAADLDGLVRIVKRKLKKTQYRPHLIDGCLAGTGLTIDPR